MQSVYNHTPPAGPVTHVRRPNRRHVPELAELVHGGDCPVSGKARYLDRRTAETARMLTAKRDTDPERAARLHVFHCPPPGLGCGDWHVGHG